MEADIQKGTYNGLVFSTTTCMGSHDPYLGGGGVTLIFL